VKTSLLFSQKGHEISLSRSYSLSWFLLILSCFERQVYYCHFYTLKCEDRNSFIRILTTAYILFILEIIPSEMKKSNWKIHFP
jgi:hypothetical protein